MDVWLKTHTKIRPRMSYVARFVLWAAVLLVGTAASCSALIALGMGMLSVPIVLIAALAGAPWTFLYWTHFPSTTVGMEAVAFSISVLFNALVLGLIVEAMHRKRQRAE